MLGKTQGIERNRLIQFVFELQKVSIFKSVVFFFLYNMNHHLDPVGVIPYFFKKN